LKKNQVFSANRKGIHFAYCINKKKVETILFLRAISNFTEYKRLLADEQQIIRMTTEISA